MRTIKFRGKVEYPQKYFGDNDIPNGRWIVGDLHLNWFYPHIHIDTKDKYPINPNTVGQFTVCTTVLAERFTKATLFVVSIAKESLLFTTSYMITKRQDSLQSSKGAQRVTSDMGGVTNNG
jgi:hypothetical protein